MNDVVQAGGREVVLIRIPKCASRSMAAAMGLPPASAHYSVRMIEEARPGSLRGKLVIACVRDPLDRLVSWHEYHADAEPDIYYGRGVQGFRLWVADGCPHRFRMAHPTMHPFEQWRWVFGASAAGADLRLIRHGHLAEDWAALCADLGTRWTLPWINRSIRSGAADYYDAPTLATAQAITWSDATHLQASCSSAADGLQE